LQLRSPYFFLLIDRNLSKSAVHFLGVVRCNTASNQAKLNE
jgi:hypothetical protein